MLLKLNNQGVFVILINDEQYSWFLIIFRNLQLDKMVCFLVNILYYSMLIKWSKIIGGNLKKFKFDIFLKFTLHELLRIGQDGFLQPGQ